MLSPGAMGAAEAGVAGPFRLESISLAGKTAVITGATSGIGMDAARMLARMGAHVVLSGRRRDRGADIVTSINRDCGAERAEFMALDLSSLADIRDFAARLAAVHPVIDILVNNAGVLAVPQRTETADGFELQFGTNYLGHFALTGRLLPNLMRAGSARVVNISSIAHLTCRLSLDDLNATRNYRPWSSYGDSKLAMLMFALELHRRSEAGGWGLMALAAHPGLAATEIVASGPTLGLPRAPLFQRGMQTALQWFGQSSQAGAVPTLVAAAWPGARGGDYFGPTGFREWSGPVGSAHIAPQARDEAVAAELWRLSEEMTGVRFSPVD
jgi:NAD(P)-dependent dehydrogenase (short-subunit alcohol dehydrogenase family)